MELEVRHLRAICTIAEAGSISRAAVVLKMSQPALAAQLRRIERMFGGPLFERGREGARPTQLGSWVLIRSRSLLPAFDELRRDGMRYAGQAAERPRIRVGCMSSHLAITVITCLSELFPGADVLARTEEAMDLLPGLLESERLELATLGDYPGHELSPPPGVSYASIADEPIFVGLAAFHPLAGREEIELRDLADEDWGMHALAEAGHREHFWTACALQGFEPRVAYSADLSLALDLIASARCVGMFQATSKGYPGIAIRPLAGTPLRFRHLVGWTEQGPVARLAPELVTAVTTAYWAEARQAPVYAAWLDRHGPLPAPV
ncbi:LysR family transcriptional regulator [Planomonospora sp. ID67723]|uniref:LysR family transcriptional regulator n=1 Tax=Planomonospora sp. ID67723 TaxID=2738134 RepID=UPI0018C380E0|nr:LysR family transcriptional regulator [Planomonospora sp. ID67723]MBG0833212.1 LysR family transcriptional regulator [Planomonospora sp. ID67723]